MKPRLIIEQKITAFTNLYKVFGIDEGGERGELVAYAQQKRLAFKEQVTFYSDEAKTTAVFTLRAEKVLDIHGRFIIEDSAGNALGMFRKAFKQSLLASTWILMDQKGNDIFKITESNTALAFFRRYASWLPIVGDIIEIITNFLKYHFVFMHVATEQEIGKYQKTTLFRDHYTLSMTDESYAVSDWRVLAAMGVALDALQSR